MKNIFGIILTLLVVGGIIFYIKYQSLGPGEDVQSGMGTPVAVETNDGKTETSTAGSKAAGADGKTKAAATKAAPALDLSKAKSFEIDGFDAEVTFTIYAGIQEKMIEWGDVSGTILLPETGIEGGQITVTNLTEMLVYAEDARFEKVLKSDKLFNVNEFPEAFFRSNSITKDGERYKVAGDMEIVGKAIPINFLADIKRGDEGVSFETEFKVDRKAWGLNYSGIGNYVIKDDVLINVSLAAEE